MSPKIVAEKSTVPVNAAESITKVLEHLRHVSFEVLSNPILAEGTVRDLLQFVLILGSGASLIVGFGGSCFQKTYSALCILVKYSTYLRWLNTGIRW